MRRGRHAADDGSFGRSAGTAVGRGLVLVAIAVVIGLVLLNRVDAPADDEQVRAGGDDRTEETTTTTTAARPTTTTVALRAPKDVKVLSANGTTVKGAGGRVKDKLLAAGYNALAATDTTSPAQGSAVLYAAGYEREAAVVAQVLALPPTTVQTMPATPPVADLKGANVLVVVGPDLAAQSASTSSTTSTTRASGATSSTTSTTRASGATSSTTSTTR